jgi:glyoxylase-like metal-dependent hydrolase (beta-lactamase superfamily II)
MARDVYERGRVRLSRFGPLGPYANNAYVVTDLESNASVIVDMPAESEAVLEAVRGTRVERILVTHHHFDHWGAYDAVKAATGAPVYVHEAEVNVPEERVDGRVRDGEEVPVGGSALQVIHTPGHTPGSMCLLLGPWLVTGDTLFPGGPGRTQRPDDLRQIVRSITQRLYVLPDDTIVLPGHGDTTTLGRSREEYAVFASKPHPDDLCGDVLWLSS